MSNRNNYAEGTPEWYAYGHGHDHGLCWMTERPEPLDGQWAGSPLPHEVIRDAWRNVMGGDWDTYVDGDDADRDGDGSILDAWESGYHDSFVGRRPTARDPWAGNPDTDKHWGKSR